MPPVSAVVRVLAPRASGVRSGLASFAVHAAALLICTLVVFVFQSEPPDAFQAALIPPPSKPALLEIGLSAETGGALPAALELAEEGLPVFEEQTQASPADAEEAFSSVPGPAAEGGPAVAPIHSFSATFGPSAFAEIGALAGDAGTKVSDDPQWAPGSTVDSPGGSGPPAFSARSGEAKRAALLRHGGTEETEAAVLLALKWLGGQQAPKGFWKTGAMRFDSVSKGWPAMPLDLARVFYEPIPKGDPAKLAEWNKKRQEASRRWQEIMARWNDENPDRGGLSGATGLALLAFLGAGHTEKNGEFKEIVRKAAAWLESAQGKDGSYAEFTYGHAIATLAMAENFALTGARKESARRAVTQLLARQNKGGGWDYGGVTAKDRNDASITCWAVMALKSAQAAGLEVPEGAFKKAREFFKQAGAETDGSPSICYAFTLNPDARHALAIYPNNTGTGLVAMGVTTLSYLGQSRDHPFIRKGSDLLSKIGPKGLNLYHLYYATLAEFQEGGEAWKRWNAEMQKRLLAIQDKAGPTRGRFQAAHCVFGPYGGDVYTTAMAALTLEVYYRYLPAYELIEGPSFGRFEEATSGAKDDPAGLLKDAQDEEKKGEIALALALYEHVASAFPARAEAARAREAIARIRGAEKDRAALGAALEALKKGRTEWARFYLKQIAAGAKDEKILATARALLAKLPPPPLPRDPYAGADADDWFPPEKEPEPPPLPPSPAEIESLRLKIQKFENAEKARLLPLRREVLAKVEAASGKRSEAFMEPYRKVLDLHEKAGIPGPEKAAFAAFYKTNGERQVFEHNKGFRDRLSAEEFRYLLLLNDYRMRLALNPLRVDFKLVTASRKHSEEMARLKYFAHESKVPENATPWKRAANEGTSAHGEVLFYGRKEAKEAFWGWLYSPGHHKVLVMRCDRVGIGVHAGTMWTSMHGMDRPAYR